MKKIAIYSLLAGILLSGCVQVPTEQVPSTSSQLAASSVWDVTRSYPANTSFSIKPTYVKDSVISQAQQEDFYQLYAQAIKKQFLSKGYQYLPQGGDLTVEYGIALTEDLSDSKISEKFGVTPGLAETETLSKGSFLIAVEETTSAMRVWRGAVQGFVQEDYSLAQREARTQHVVSIVLAQFFSAQ